MLPPPLPDPVATNPRELECSGRFRLLRTLAEGGTATVYEAEQIGAGGFNKRVALKLIQPALTARPEFLTAFLRETRRSANLMHGNIVQLYQLGEMGGEYFLSMELVAGPTIQQLLDRHRVHGRPIPPTLAAYITSRLCRALDYAQNVADTSGQRLDIIHGRLSPSKALVTWAGHIKLAAFGVARASYASGLPGGEAVAAARRPYTSPEQRLGGPPSPHADVYSLGVLLYELLTLVHLTTEETTGRLLHGLDTGLEYLLRQALATDPNRRPSAAAMGIELDRWIAAQPTHGSFERLQHHLSRLFPEQVPSTIWTTQLPNIGFTALERAVRHNSNGRSGLLEQWFGRAP